MKYVIKNCDNYTEFDKDWTCRSTIQNRKGCYVCQDCTDCVLKQIVELCKPIKKEYLKHKLDALIAGKFNIAGKILLLLNIQEVE